MKKPKVMMVGLDLNPPWVEGIRNTVRAFSRNLIEDGYNVLALTKGSNNHPSYENIEGIKYYRILVGQSSYYLSGSLLFLIKLPIKIMKLAKREKIQIIHGHSVYPALGIILGLISKILGIKNVFTLYSTPFNKNTNTNNSIIISLLNLLKSPWLTKILAIFVDSLIVISRSTMKDLIYIGISPHKIRYIPVGVDLAVFKSSDKSAKTKIKLDIPTNKKIILFAGDESPWKGVDIFLKAISMVSNKYSDIFCIILTKGLYEHEVKRKKEIFNLINFYGIEKHVCIIGPYENIKEIYEIADMVVMPFISLSAVMDIPLSLLEAMAMGKPVIVSNIIPFTEIISNFKNGILVKPNDEIELAEAIITLIRNKKLYKDISDNVRQTIEENHDVRKLTQKLKSLYRELLYDEVKEYE